MQLCMLDRICLVEAGKKLEAVQALSGGERYLLDHFPAFPVMPGVLMLEALSQSAMWLVHATEGFTSAAVYMKEARNVKFADFLQPGQTMQVVVEMLKVDGNRYSIKASAIKGEISAVSARLVMESHSFASDRADLSGLDKNIQTCMHREYQRLLAKGLAAAA